MTARPFRVLYLMHSGSPAGSAESLCLLLEHFPAGAVSATVLCPDGESRAATPEDWRHGPRSFPGVSMLHSIEGVPLRGVRLLDLEPNYLDDAAWRLAIRAAIREMRPDIVHLNERGMLHAARIAHQEGVPVVLHARSVGRAARQLGAAAFDEGHSAICRPAWSRSTKASASLSPGRAERRRSSHNPLDNRALTEAPDVAPRSTAAAIRFAGSGDLSDRSSGVQGDSRPAP